MRDPFCGSFILDQAGVNTIKFSIFQLSPILHIFALLRVTLRANDVKFDVNDVGGILNRKLTFLFHIQLYF